MLAWTNHNQFWVQVKLMVYSFPFYSTDVRKYKVSVSEKGTL